MGCAADSHFHSGEDVGGEAGPEARMSAARDVYSRAYRSLRDTQPGAREEAVMLLEGWKEFEAGQTSWR